MWEISRGFTIRSKQDQSPKMGDSLSWFVKTGYFSEFGMCPVEKKAMCFLTVSSRPCLETSPHSILRTPFAGHCLGALWGGKPCPAELSEGVNRVLRTLSGDPPLPILQTPSAGHCLDTHGKGIHKNRWFSRDWGIFVSSLTLQSLLFFWQKQGFFPQKARVFLFAEPLKSLEKRGKTHKKARKIGKRKKARKSKKQGLEGQGSPLLFQGNARILKNTQFSRTGEAPQICWDLADKTFWFRTHCDKTRRTRTISIVVYTCCQTVS